MPRGRKQSFAYVNGQRPLEPLKPGEVQCPHTLKPQATTGCSMCLGAAAVRMKTIEGPQEPEARPSNPTKHGGC